VPAEPAAAAGSAEPGHADPVTARDPTGAGSEGVDVPDHLVARHDRWVSLRKVALCKVQIGPADPATTYAQPHLTWTGHGFVALTLVQGSTFDRPGSVDPPHAHANSQPDNDRFHQG
jgi:hypothetical protein